MDIRKVPLEKLTGWQEVNMDVDRINAVMESARLAPLERRMPLLLPRIKE